MAPKSISTSSDTVGCDICGRTLLRGEHADVYLDGGTRRSVCELCTSRAIHEGWIREGLDDPTLRDPGARRGARSLLGRLRPRRQRDDDGGALAPMPVPDYDPTSYDPDHFVGDAAAPEPRRPVTPAGYEEHHGNGNGTEQPVERRQVHAVPSNSDLKLARALDVFNASAHRRTVAGVARSLGAPLVAARPSATEGSIVSITVAWELSWYRYEVDLADEASGVRVVAQGNEMDELEAVDRVANAAADEQGELHPATASH